MHNVYDSHIHAPEQRIGDSQKMDIMTISWMVIMGQFSQTLPVAFPGVYVRVNNINY